MKEQRFSDAIQFYTLAISFCNDNAIFYANRAAAHSEVSKFAEAIADCENAIRIDPKYSKAYSRLGWVYHAQGHFQEAIEKGFQKALNLDPNNATAKENLMVLPYLFRTMVTNVNSNMVSSC
jgi:small glutamine-rich tetratricopeptide repeat-containing protein alpha